MKQAPNLVEHMKNADKERSLRAEVQHRPRDAGTNFAMAKFLAESGRRAEALPFAELACTLAPRNFQYLYYCGALYRDFDQPEFAIRMLKASVDLEPRVFLSQYDLADCYYHLGKGENALDHFRSALKLASTATERSKARFGLANCLADSGESDQARRLLETLLQDADLPLAVKVSCKLAPLLNAKPGSAIEKRMLQYLAHPDLKDEAQEAVFLALGNIHFASGQYDKAFEYWQMSREVAKRITYPNDGRELRNHLSDFESRAKFFTPDFVRALKQYGHLSNAPVFITGMPRSGTTLTEQILGSHPRAAAVGEIGRWPRVEMVFYKDYSGSMFREKLLANSANGELKARAEEHLMIMGTIAGGDYSRFIEKTTHVFISLGYLATCFPNAKFLHLIRHPADTFISTYQHQFNRYFRFAYDQEEFAKEYAFSLRMMNLWKSLYPESIDTYYYEDLIDRTEECARRMIEFIGLPWDDRCLRYHEAKGVVRTFSAPQVKKPIYRTSIDKWKVFEKHLGPLLKELERQGVTYQPGKVTVGR
jgi:tetratricopeptide (TPR) repeat protein